MLGGYWAGMNVRVVVLGGFVGGLQVWSRLLAARC